MNSNTILTIACTVALLASRAFADDPSTATQQQDEFEFSSTQIGTFLYGDKSLRIWPSLRNKDNAREWQFCYDPLFAPEVKLNSQLAIESKPFGPAGLWRDSLTIFLDTPEAKQLAHSQIIRVESAEASDVQTGSAIAMPVREVAITIPDLASLYPNARLVQNTFDFNSPVDSLTLTIETPNETMAKAVVKDLASMTIQYTISFRARQSNQNWVKFSYKSLKDSQLYIKLNGLGSTTEFVHRDDLRKLLDNITNEVDFHEVIEQPADFDEGLLNKLLNRWDTTVSSQDFDATKWRSTYDASDLQPNVISHSLNEMFSKSTGEQQWKYNTSFSTAGKAGFLDILSAEGSAQGSFSDEGLKKFLEEQ